MQDRCYILCTSRWKRKLITDWFLVGKNVIKNPFPKDDVYYKLVQYRGMSEARSFSSAIKKCSGLYFFFGFVGNPDPAKLYFFLLLSNKKKRALSVLVAQFSYVLQLLFPSSILFWYWSPLLLVTAFFKKYFFYFLGNAVQLVSPMYRKEEANKKILYYFHFWNPPRKN